MKQKTRFRLALLVPVVLIVAMILSACAAKVPRLTKPFTFSPGAAFTANINGTDPRKMVKCAVVFEVFDEAATAELTDYTFIIRNAVLVVLGELTEEKLTTDRDLQDIALRLVEKVNEVIPSNVPLVVGAYFTDFVFSA